MVWSLMPRNIDAVGKDFIDWSTKFGDALAGLVSNRRSLGTAGMADVIGAVET